MLSLLTMHWSGRAEPLVSEDLEMRLWIKCFHQRSPAARRSTQVLAAPMIVPALPGADKIVEWWGGWTTFHDCYLLAAPASGDARGTIRIHGWVVDWEDTDSEGHFLTGGHCVVEFDLNGIESVNIETEPEMADFPAIISEFLIEPKDERWLFCWTSSYGSAGQIVATSARIRLVPGHPAVAQSTQLTKH